MAVTPERLIEIEAKLAELYAKKKGSNEVNARYGITGGAPNFLPSDFRKIHFTDEDENGVWTNCIVNGEVTNQFRLDRYAFEALVTAMQTAIQTISNSYQSEIDTLEAEKNAP